MLKRLLYEDEEKETEGERESNRGKKGKNGNDKYLPIIILNVNGLNAPIKRHRVAE